MFVTPSVSVMPLRSAVRTAGTRNTLGAVMAGVPPAGVLVAGPRIWKRWRLVEVFQEVSVMSYLKRTSPMLHPVAVPASRVVLAVKLTRNP